MGFDISNHPVDVTFIRERLIPAIRGQARIDDFLDRAAQMAVVAHRANQWGLRATRLSSAITGCQLDEVPPPPSMPPRKGLLSWLRRLFGGKGTPGPRMRHATGLPGFDSDLSVWGRPFFITVQEADAALQTLERYSTCAADDAAAVDAVAREQLAIVEARRGSRPADVSPALWDVVLRFYPLLSHLPPSEESGVPEVAAVREHMASRLDLMQTVWAHRHSKEMLEHPCLMEPEEGAALAQSIPLEVIGFAAQGLPGWMGRGYVWPTELFRKIGVKERVFETPAALFAELLAELPAMGENFRHTIFGNYSLGGYVPPARVPELRTLLLRHRRDFILAWSDEKALSDAEVENMAADFQKILEPVVLAERNGYGFIEAAEVYSGFMGVMN